MKTVRLLLNEIQTQFELKKIVSFNRQAEELICDYLNWSWADLHLRLDDQVSEKDCRQLFKWMTRRLKGEPLPYIKGKIEFYHCQFLVNQSVLIPRQETEVLVDQIAHFLQAEPLKGKILWDICCGSGCIGIALKKKFPDLIVCASDISEKALTVAKENARLNQTDILFFEGDLLKPFVNQKADYIICNPPYISKQEFLELEKDVVDYEPHLALLGGETGLEVYERLAVDLFHHLKPQGKVWLETGYRQGKALFDLFDQSNWTKREFKNDWAGHNRFFFLENE